MRGGIVAEKSAVCRSAGVGLEDRLEVLGEAHVEHLVGFVEHQRRARRRASSVPRRRWSSARPGVATTTSTPRSSARICCGHRARRRRAGTTLSAGASRVLVDRLGHLHRELARRHEDERRGSRRAPRVVRRPRRCEHRQRERRRLAGAGGRLRRAGRAPRAAAGSPRAGRRRLLVAERVERLDEPWRRGRGRRTWTRGGVGRGTSHEAGHPREPSSSSPVDSWVRRTLSASKRTPLSPRGDVGGG